MVIVQRNFGCNLFSIVIILLLTPSPLWNDDYTKKIYVLGLTTFHSSSRPTTTTTIQRQCLSKLELVPTKTIQQQQLYNKISNSNIDSTTSNKNNLFNSLLQKQMVVLLSVSKTNNEINVPPIVVEEHEDKDDDVQDDDIIGLSDRLYEPKTISLFDNYKYNYKLSIDDATYEKYWSDQAYKYLDWDTNFHTVQGGSLLNGDVTWFTGGKLNIAYNAIDRHVNSGLGDTVAILWEGDEPNNVQSITYNQLLQKVSQISLSLRSMGVKKGDVVTIYMPMIPELPMTMLACTRIGAIHSVVFAGFSAEALSQRIIAAQSKILITAIYGQRGSKTIPLLDIVRTAQQIGTTNNYIQQIGVWDHPTSKVTTTLTSTTTDDDDVDDVDDSKPTITASQLVNKEIYMDELVSQQRPYCTPVSMDSEDYLFILYTSGSTGQPKGVVHTTGGYAVWAAMTTRTTFDLHPSSSSSSSSTKNDLFACVADCGWITGHTYVVYGPLLNGCTTFLFESTPLYPNPGRYWDMIERHQITHFYTAPTAIRSLMRYGTSVPKKYNLSSLKILGTVGEPINPEAWRWYYECIGQSKCTIVDTYWQTETGGHIITNLPGITPMKPGSCTLPMYGIDPAIVDPVSGEIIEQQLDPVSGLYNEISGVLVIRRPWPGIARTCINDHERYMTTYLRPYSGYYFTGDACRKDTNGYHVITGRVDDVLNVSGHRIGTAEVESALVAHPAVAQAAVVGKPHIVKGEAIVGFVTLKADYSYIQDDATNDTNEINYTKLIIELRNQVRNDIGAFASPDILYVTDAMPMTRSGKIMRRILRKIITNEIDTIGDTSTLADPTVVDKLIEQVNNAATSTK